MRLPGADSLRHFLLALQFFTRIPVTGRLAAWVGYSPAMLNASSGHFPGVGWVVGLWSAACMGLGLMLLPATLPGLLAAAVLATAGSVWLTGGFHEDGLADMADGLGGSAGRERAMQIMKDSRIGSYGTLALMLALALKLALLALLAERGTGLALTALLTAHVLSRLAPLVVMHRLPYVSEDSVSKSKPLAETVSPASFVWAAVWSVPALALLLASHGMAQAVAALLLQGLVLLACLRLLRRRLQGFTGDTLGAVQQLGELAIYLGLALHIGA